MGYPVRSTEEVNLTNSMEQSPSWEANSHSASQEIPSLLRNQKVHYRVDKSPTTGPYPAADNQDRPVISSRRGSHDKQNRNCFNYNQNPIMSPRGAQCQDGRTDRHRQIQSNSNSDCTRWLQTTFSHSISLISILILSHLRLGLSKFIRKINISEMIINFSNRLLSANTGRDAAGNS
jgi:hypothetical protein